MTTLPPIRNIETYLRQAGWQRHQETWNNASIWSDADGHEVLVPASDDLADTDLRVAEILSNLTAAEDRPVSEIATDIDTPFDDIQLYRTSSNDGLVSLAEELQTLGSIRDLINAAARTVVDGPLAIISRSNKGPVRELLQQIRLGPGSRSAELLTVRIPLTNVAQSSEAKKSAYVMDETPLGRQVGARLRTAVLAARKAVTQAAGPRGVTAFDRSVAAGVSANLCEALARLAGNEQAQPFEITFRWGRGLPSDVPAGTVRFPRGSGVMIRDGAARLRQVGNPSVSGEATIIGLVESLHGRASKSGWQIDVHGDLRTSDGIQSEQAARVYLESQEAYDQAIAAHRFERQVRAHGEMSGTLTRTQLVVSNENFGILEGNA